MRDSCENCRYLTTNENGNRTCGRNGWLLSVTNQLCKRWAMKRFPKQAQRKKPQKCNILYQGEIIATMASRHNRKIEDLVRDHRKNLGHDNGNYSIECFYCKRHLSFIESSWFFFMKGAVFCPDCFPEESKQQREFFELQ